VRLSAKTSLGSADVLLRDGVATSVTSLPHPIRGRETTGNVSPDDLALACDAWSYGLLTFYGADKYRVTFDELLAQPNTLRAARRVTDAGRELVYVDLSHKRARQEIWFDPDKNYLVKKLILSVDQPPAKERVESVVVKYLEASAGVFFPEQVESRWSEGSESGAVQTAKFTNIVINHPIAPETFSLRFPAGILVLDGIQGKVMKTDSNGMPTLRATDSGGEPLKLTTVSPIRASAGSGSDMRPTESERRPWTDWLLPVSVAVVCISGALWLAKKVRSLSGRAGDS
jgi:hypothetical protein